LFRWHESSPKPHDLTRISFRRYLLTLVVARGSCATNQISQISLLFACITTLRVFSAAQTRLENAQQNLNVLRPAHSEKVKEQPK
jgi:hypothetical protein